MAALLLVPSCSSFMQSSATREEEAWKKDFKNNLRVMEKNGYRHIPVYFLERDDCEYGAYNGTPKRVGMITTADLEELLDQERIPPSTETLDYWYALRLEIPRNYPEIGLSLTPCEELGITLLYKKQCARIGDSQLYAKILNMLPQPRPPQEVTDDCVPLPIDAAASK